MNSNRTRIVALATGAAVLSGPVALVTAGSAAADVERQGVCKNGVYEFSVDREGRHHEASVDLDGLTPGTTWRVVLRHNGERVAVRRIVADAEGDVEFERTRLHASGQDTWRFKARQVGTGKGCGASITLA